MYYNDIRSPIKRFNVKQRRQMDSMRSYLLKNVILQNTLTEKNKRPHQSWRVVRALMKEIMITNKK